MAATPSVKITKQMTYRGVPRLWSNRYHFNGGTPADLAHWQTFFDAITAVEKTIYGPDQQIVRADGYAAGSEVPVATKTYTLTGTGSFGASWIAPGDSVILLRFATATRTSKNHPVFLYNYFHGARINGSTSGDIPNGTQVTSIGTYASDWISGFSDGSTVYNRAGPRGASATGSVVETYITHRDFPR